MEKSENSSITYQLTATEGKKRVFVFHGEAKISEIFSLICMYRQITLGMEGGERDSNI